MTAAIRALIVDDEPAARDAIRVLLAPDHEVTVVGETADGRAALDAIRALRPDLLFLDVQMPELDGLSALRQLDPADLPVTVFTTAYDAYALQAFELHALDYLLKPFDDTRFHSAVERAKQRVREGRLGAARHRLLELLEAEPPGTATGGSAGVAYVSRLVVKHEGRATIVAVRDIDWLEADGDHVRVYAGGARHVLRDSLRHLETQLDPHRFVRIHRSTMVNVERIRELQPYFRGDYVVILQDGSSHRLARSCKARLVTVLGWPF